MAAFALVFNVNERRPRQFRDRINTLENFCDEELIERYRFPREGIEDIIDLVKEDVGPMCQRSHALDPTTKTLVTLRYLAKGDFFSETGDLHGVSRSSVSRCVSEVVSSINRRLNNITFPLSDVDVKRCKRKFHQIAGLPNVVGAIDGTLIPIIAPTGLDEPTYVCRKGYHAINVQAVAGPDLRFTDVVAKWPGSQHDAGIFERCRLKTHLEERDCGWLLGDSGYPLKKYLITPKSNANRQEEVNFNLAHSQTRMVVERAFGVLKSRFRCLHKSAGVLPFTPEKCCQVTTACMRLHNKCIEMGMPVPIPNGEDHGDHDTSVFNDQGNSSAQQIRQTLINNFR